ncbi:MAG: peroxiredoxin [Silvanigrellaceae bacterium]
MASMAAVASKVLLVTGLLNFSVARADALKVGDSAPNLNLITHEGQPFSLESRKGKGWTILYFYPKAGTPGCTKQACAFRDAAENIRKQGAEIYGISTDTAEKLASFHKEHNLKFTLLADPEAKAAEAFGVKIPVIKIAKRWTFMVDPDLKIRNIDDNVDPLLDAKNVADMLKKFSAKAETKKQ